MITLKKFHPLYFSDYLVQKVWEKATIIENIDPGIYRLDNCGALIKNAFYLKEYKALSSGWGIDLIKPKSKGGIDELSNLQALQWENKEAKGESYPLWKCIISRDNKGNYYLK